MWNHSQNANNHDHDLTYQEKLEKCFDLSPYLNYVQHLFNAPSSDSETSDNEVQGHTSLVSGQTGSQNSLMPDLPPSSNSSFSGHSSLNSSPGSSSTSDLSSCSDSELQTKDSSLGSKLKPISDEELQSLLRVHKSWKKSPYPLGSDEDIMSLFNATSSSKRNNINTGTTSGGGSSSSSKSITNKNSRTMGSGGNTMSVTNTSFEPQITSDNKNRSRKQSFKVLRREEVAGVSSSSSSTSSSTITKVIIPTIQLNQSSSSSIGSSTTNIDNTLVTNALKSIHMDGDIKNEDIKRIISVTAQAANVSVTGAPTNFMDDDDESENDEDDDDSLSDYVSMAATVQSAGGQMLSNSIQNIVSFKNVITSAASASSSSSSSTTQSSVNSKQGISTTSSKAFNTGSTSLENPKKKKEKDLKDVPKQKKLTPHKQAKLIEVLNMKRRRVYVLLCKKEIGKTQRARTNNHKEMLVMKRRLAQGCSRMLRQKAIQSQKTMKESVWRAKRLTREMLAYWKQADRVEREVRKKREKEAEEQRKLDVEIMEAKRQQRKLNFLITQTELYAHFMSKKLGRNPGEDESRILSQLNEEKSTRVSRVDGYDSEVMKTKAKMNVENAFKTQLAQVQLFDLDVAMRDDFKTDVKLEGGGELDELPQPEMFTGILKHYQLKGMNWLINLYDQGINGILADEMGLGKTVQSIAFLAYVAERYRVWGPFLIIAPASTLHNWQQEFKRFVPNFKVVPYWGNPQERKILRQFWQQSNVHTEEASFHVVVTSYQIVMTDIKYFNRIKWQYLILDEAQAIKSTASARWKMLLGFSCRNRLLLTGTPIQNTMGELWALLHFIMPSLFDSHEEFNEWFSKDIESHAENKSFQIDEKHLSRLHLILKPFMLRRIKKDVENELSDKVEVLVYCPLTSRQRLLYQVLKKKIRIEDLLKSSGPSNSQLAQHATTNLMNLVMQFRKVCNHPDLFERREIQSPYFLPTVTCLYPKLIFRDGILHLNLPSKRHLLENKFSIFNPEHIHRSISSVPSDKSPPSEWSFLRLSGVGVGEMGNLMYGGLVERWKYLLRLFVQLESIYHQRTWTQEEEESESSKQMSNLSKCLNPCDLIIWPENRTSFLNVKHSVVLKDLIFTSRKSPVYKLADHKIHRIPETLEHRKMRSRKNFPELKDPPLMPEVTSAWSSSPDGENVEIRPCQRTCMPSFLFNVCPKLWGSRRELYFSDRSAAWWQREHQMCTSSVGYNLIVNGQSEPWSNHYKKSKSHFIEDEELGGLSAIQPTHGWSRVVVPDKEKLVTDSGKLGILDNLLRRLKMNGHRVLIYSQMTKMIDILEEYMWHRKWTYMRLDGSSKIAERRDMVADFQTRSDIFVFLLSTRAGGLGINLTAADTVIFYDSDWNPTVDQQAMDRAHRLGQTKQVHVYRLICKGTIEERILQRAREKNEIQRMVISGGNFRSDTLKPKEVVSLLLDDEELEKKYRQKQAERKLVEEVKSPAEEGGKESKLSVASLNLKRKHPKTGGNSSDKLLTSVSSSLEVASNVSSSAPGSMEGSAPDSPSRSDVLSTYQDMVAGEVEIDSEVYQECIEEEVSSISNEGSTSFQEEMDVQLSPIEGFNKTIEWNTDIHSDGFEADFPVLPKRPKVGRGTGKRGRPPSRVRQVRETDGDNSVEHGLGSHSSERRRPGRPPSRVRMNIRGPSSGRPPGRPRLRPVGPANQGVRGRRPGRPPLSRKAESLSSSLKPLTTSQCIFGFYSSPDLDLS